jgi:hypothetical protein
MRVAYSPVIDNEDVFDPDEIRYLLSILFTGPTGLIEDDDDRTRPSTDYQNRMYIATERAQLNVERAIEDPSEIYRLYGEKAQALREFHGIEEDENTDE